MRVSIAAVSPPDQSPYRNPDTPNARAPWNPRALRVFGLGLLSLVLSPAVISALTLIERHSSGAAPLILTLFVGSMVAAFALGLYASRLGAKVRAEVDAFPTAERGRWLATAGMLAGWGAMLMQVLGFAFACLSVTFIGRGRQLRRRGVPLLPRVVEGGEWTSPSPMIDAPAELRDRVASRWRENGRTEHASVASFSRLALDLMALGAPPSLIAAAQRDALDEVRHAELCFSLARSIDGRVESPGAFPEAGRARGLSRVRTVALSTLAVDSLVDGAFHEGTSARVIASLARRCPHEGITAALREIAADEGRHAAHGWDVVEWCLTAGGPAVARALLGAVEGIASRAPSMRAVDDESDAFEAWGLHGAALERAERERAIEEVTARARRLALTALARA